MTAELLVRIGGPVAAAGLALVLLGRDRRVRLLGLLTWLVGMALFLPLLLPSEQSVLLAGAGVVGVVVALALAYVFHLWPWALAFLTLAAVPARLPVTVGDVSANLLVPLYAVIAGATALLAWTLWRDGPRARELGLLCWPVALFVGWTGLSAVWSNDPREGAVELFFFILPFPLLALALARLPWSERALGWLGRLLVAMALLFAVIGVWQWLTRDVFWNPKVISGNAYAPFFRVNSVFWDPSMYGRFLVVTILLALVVLLFDVWRRFQWAIVVLIGALWVGLVLSFSQSSFAALVVGVVTAAVLAWRWRAVTAVGLAAAVLITVGLAASVQRDAGRELVAGGPTELDRATSGRFQLVQNGLRIAADHPVAGVGVGSFKSTYAERFELPARTTEAASHNTPVTVAAETGVVGLGLLVWLLVAAGLVSLRGLLSRPPAAQVAGVVAAVGLTAIFVHSLAYNAFFEDPLMWGLLALGALAADQASTLHLSGDGLAEQGEKGRSDVT
jgi:O-antigen ligase